jgi:hypothetical protein
MDEWRNLMAYVLYEVASTRIVTEKRYGKESYQTEAAAKSARTRLLRKGKRINGQHVVYKPEDLAVAEARFYAQNIEKMVERVNMMSGKKYIESINTPNYCSPASEAYWSM